MPKVGRTTSITPTTPAIEIATPCELSFSAARRIKFLVACLTMASSKDFRASADEDLLLMMLYSVKVINFIRFPSRASSELHNDTRNVNGMAELIALRCFGRER